MPTLELILRKYPIKNSAWYATENGAVIVTDASDLGICAQDSMTIAVLNGRVRDPWNRVFPGKNKTNVVHSENGELECWNLITTVEGIKIVCKIFND